MSSLRDFGFTLIDFPEINFGATIWFVPTELFCVNIV